MESRPAVELTELDRFPPTVEGCKKLNSGELRLITTDPDPERDLFTSPDGIVGIEGFKSE